MTGQASPLRSNELLSLAENQFYPLREAEEKLLRAAPAGETAWCGPTQQGFDSANDPRKADTWGPQRSIRAELLRWLCVEREAKERVDARGIQVHAAKIEGELDLSFVVAPFPIVLSCCCLKEEAKLRFLEIPTLSLAGSRVRSLNAECASIKGTLYLNNAFSTEGEVHLVGAQIGSNLDCSGGNFRNPTGKALRGDRMKIGGSVFLRNGFSAEGEVRLLSAQIGSNLECNDGIFKSVASKALSADRINVQGSVFLRDGFTAEGQVRLLGAQIGGNLECSAGTFRNSGGTALNADRVSVEGNVLLSGGFCAEGEVNLLGAQIGNNLACDGGSFKNPGGRALNGDSVNVKGFVFFRNGFLAEGEVNLLSAQVGDNLACDAGTFRNPAARALNADRINVQGNVLFRNAFSAEGEVRLVNGVVKGTLVWTGVRNPQEVALNLRNASAGSILDDKASWPPAGKLDLDGFVYAHITSGLTDTKTRLAWLELQKPFTPQPYRQLAKVMRDAGVDRGALRVLFEMEDHLWREERGLASLLFRWPLSLIVGYGYYPLRALLGLAILVGIGWAVYAGANATGAMAPRQESAYQYFKAHGYPPQHYEPLKPLVYSLENSLPLVKLNQIDYWQPDPAPAPLFSSGMAASSSMQNGLRQSSLSMRRRLLFFFFRLQVLLGWVLATLFIAGVTGIVTKG